MLCNVISKHTVELYYRKLSVKKLIVHLNRKILIQGPSQILDTHTALEGHIYCCFWFVFCLFFLPWHTSNLLSKSKKKNF